jgi:hypothetical protein
MTSKPTTTTRLEGRKLAAAIRRQKKYDADIQKPEGTWDRQEAEGQVRRDHFDAIDEERKRNFRANKAARAAAKAAATPTTTCQICGRAIMATTGVIAHHGYTRPNRGSGWQTASCMGARALPYEVSRDLIPVAIRQVESYRDRMIEAAGALEAGPPTITTAPRRRFDGTTQKPVTYEKPADWTLDAYASMPHTYANVLATRLAGHRHEIRGAEMDITTLRARYDAWVAPR